MNQTKIRSKRKIEIFSLIAQGYCQKQIAERLFLSEGVIRFHVYNGMKEIGAKSSANAVYKLTKAGII